MTLLQHTRTGLLELHFAVCQGKTILQRDTQKAPLMIIRPFELPCGTLMVFIVNPTGGVLGGDESQIKLTVESGARVLVLTQSATRVQPSHLGVAAVQHIEAKVQSGGRLEFYPERTIPFAESKFHQYTQIELDQGAELGLTETLATGRVHSGECLAFKEYRSRIEVWQAGQRVFLDQQQLKPSQHTRNVGILGTQNYLATGVWVGNREIEDFPKVSGQLASGMTAGGAIWLRSIAQSGPPLDQALNQARESLRSQLFGASPLVLRR